MSRELLVKVQDFLIDHANLGFSSAEKLLEEVDAALEKPEVVYADLPRMEHWSEEYECATLYLNDKGVPTRDDDGRDLSLVGRIERYRLMSIRDELAALVPAGGFNGGE